MLGAGATTAITTSAGAGMVVELTLGVGFFFVGADFAADFAAGFAEVFAAGVFLVAGFAAAGVFSVGFAADFAAAGVFEPATFAVAEVFFAPALAAAAFLSGAGVAFAAAGSATVLFSISGALVFTAE